MGVFDVSKTPKGDIVILCNRATVSISPFNVLTLAVFTKHSGTACALTPLVKPFNVLTLAVFTKHSGPSATYLYASNSIN